MSEHNNRTSDTATNGTEHHVALCSGGKDSIAATHAAMMFGPAEEVVFLDTGTGPEGERSAIDATTEWIRSWCDENGWPFASDLLDKSVQQGFK